MATPKRIDTLTADQVRERVSQINQKLIDIEGDDRLGKEDTAITHTMQFQRGMLWAMGEIAANLANIKAELRDGIGVVVTS